MEKSNKFTRGLGIAVEVIIVLDFMKELYVWSMPKLKKCLARRKSKPQPEEGEADYESEE